MRVGSVVLLLWTTAAVIARRLGRGPRRRTWTLAFEIATRFFQAQDVRVTRAAVTQGIAGCREIVDSLTFRTPVLDLVRVEEETRHPGSWFVAPKPGPTILYFHGGGYAFYPKMTDNIAAAVAACIGGRMFVSHYPLAPEHPFPAQLDAARLAYRWLVDNNRSSAPIIVAGDSAGGHLLLTLLLTLPGSGLPKPDAAVAISPWTDPFDRRATMTSNAAFDWMSQRTGQLLARWAGPALAELENLAEWLDDRSFAELPPLLVHAGELETCRPMIEQFCARTARSGAPLTMRIWPDMNHNFHGFADLMPQSRDALDAIAAFVAMHCQNSDSIRRLSPTIASPP